MGGWIGIVSVCPNLDLDTIETWHMADAGAVSDLGKFNGVFLYLLCTNRLFYQVVTNLTYSRISIAIIT